MSNQKEIELQLNRCYFMNRVTPGKDNTFFIFSWLFALVLGETIETVFKSNRSLHVQFAMRTVTVIKSQIRINRTFQFCFPVPIAFSFPFLSFVPDIIWIPFFERLLYQQHISLDFPMCYSLSESYYIFDASMG